MERDRLRGEALLGTAVATLVGMVGHDWFNPLSVFVLGRWLQMYPGNKSKWALIATAIFAVWDIGEIGIQKYVLHDLPTLLQGDTDKMYGTIAYSAITTGALFGGRYLGPIPGAVGRTTESVGRWTKGVSDAIRGR